MFELRSLWERAPHINFDPHWPSLLSTESTEASRSVTPHPPPAGGNQLSAGAALKQISAERLPPHAGLSLTGDAELTHPLLFVCLFD